jgi:hypothetical protein
MRQIIPLLLSLNLPLVSHADQCPGGGTQGAGVVRIPQEPLDSGGCNYNAIIPTTGQPIIIEGSDFQRLATTSLSGYRLNAKVPIYSSVSAGQIVVRHSGYSTPTSAIFPPVSLHDFSNRRLLVDVSVYHSGKDRYFLTLVTQIIQTPYDWALHKSKTMVIPLPTNPDGSTSAQIDFSQKPANFNIIVSDVTGLNNLATLPLDPGSQITYANTINITPHFIFACDITYPDFRDSCDKNTKYIRFYPVGSSGAD